MVITKSISRFARNTVTLLETVRGLKALNVDVLFEKENIDTFDSKGELMLTILSSIAQEESRSISENVTWGQRKREKGADDLPQIVEEQAKIIRLIYRLFLEGQTPSGIASYLSENKAIIQILTDTSGIDAESANLQSECDVVQELIRKCVEENAHMALDQDTYQRRYASLIARYDAAKNKLDSVNDQRQSQRIKRESLNEFIVALGQKQELLTEFDEDLWNATVDSITIHMDGSLTFRFIDGSELPITNRTSI